MILAAIRDRGGATSYLEVLDSDNRMFSAELGVTQAELRELLSLVRTYVLPEVLNADSPGAWKRFECPHDLRWSPC
jgi:outer membrane protein TolC